MKYTVILHYDDIDGTMYTDSGAKVIMNIEADDADTAYALAKHLRTRLHADQYTVEKE